MQARPPCWQHHFFLPTDQPCCQLNNPALQSKGKEVVGTVVVGGVGTVVVGGGGTVTGGSTQPVSARAQSWHTDAQRLSVRAKALPHAPCCPLNSCCELYNTRALQVPDFPWNEQSLSHGAGGGVGCGCAGGGVGHPRPPCVQHQTFFLADHPATHVANPALQS